MNVMLSEKQTGCAEECFFFATAPLTCLIMVVFASSAHSTQVCMNPTRQNVLKQIYAEGPHSH